MDSTSNIDDHVGFWLRKLSNQLNDSFTSRTERHGVSAAQWVVLRVLFDHPALALKDIVSQVGVDQGALSRMIDRLVARDLVSRRQNPNSRREVVITLTAEARRLVPKLAREADEHDRFFFRHLGAADRAAFLSTVKTLLAQNPSRLPSTD